jgi:hypothetical protein
MRDNGDLESESEKSNCEDMPPLEDCTEDELSLLVDEYKAHTSGSGQGR